jgi:hypothetical protein
VLNGGQWWQLLRRFKIKLLNEDGAFVECWLALALSTRPENSCNLDPISKFVPVRNTVAASGFQVFCAGNIVGCGYIIPKIATSHKTGEGRKE